MCCISNTELCMHTKIWSLEYGRVMLSTLDKFQLRSYLNNRIDLGIMLSFTHSFVKRSSEPPITIYKSIFRVSDFANGSICLCSESFVVIERRDYSGVVMQGARSKVTSDSDEVRISYDQKSSVIVSIQLLARNWQRQWSSMYSGF